MFLSRQRFTVEAYCDLAPLLYAAHEPWAKRVCLHHTYKPSDRARFDAAWERSMGALERLYRANGWHAGPHLFMTEHYVYPMSPITAPGVHSVAFNADAIGLEVVGNFGPGPGPWEKGAPMPETLKRNVARVVAALNDAVGCRAESLVFHRDDPNARKTCPGTYVDRPEMVGLVRAFMQGYSFVRAVVNGRDVRAILRGGATWVWCREYAAAANTDISVLVDGSIAFARESVVVPRERQYRLQGVTYVPLKPVVDAMKGSVAWEDGMAVATVRGTRER